MSTLAHLTLAEISEGLSAKKFSSVEITRSFLDRIEQHRGINAYTEVCTEPALAQAARADEARAKGNASAYLGVPIAVKDIILTKGVRTTAASKILGNFVPPYDATVVRRLNDAGFVMLGKTNLDEFAMGSSNENSSFGPVQNPWNPEYVPGGSSGGSAAAVAGRLAPVALGTDTGGSIRQPASYCSIVGLKPTYGRVSRYGVIAYASSLDQVGPFAQNVRDCAALTEVLAGHDPYDSTSSSAPVPRFTEALGRSVKGLRIGVPKEYFIPGMQTEVESAVREALKTLESMGATLVEISLPHTESAVAVYYILAPAECSSNLARYDGIRFGHRSKEAEDLYSLYCHSRAEGFGREVKRRIMVGTYVLSTGYYDAFYRKAQKVRTLIANDFGNAFKSECDVIACPAAPTTAFKIGAKVTDPLAMYLNDVFTIPVNLAGLPGMCLPCGFDSNELPIGLQLIGKPWDEETLFTVGSAYEGATEWHRRRPVMAQ
jgi:aspartyl-tRNA(Asn)/glutamyl-tRNA(Gln) amidotransferase subunit A